MREGRPLVWSTVVLIAAMTLASGPLVGAVDLPAGPAPGPPPGTGSASVEVLSAPTTVTLQRSSFGAGTFHLEGPPARVRVDAVTGNPELRYSIDIPGLWFSDANEYALRGRAGDRVTLEFRPVELSPTRVTEDRYRGTLAIWLVTDGDTYRTVHQASVTIEVAR